MRALTAAEIGAKIAQAERQLAGAAGDDADLGLCTLILGDWRRYAAWRGEPRQLARYADVAP